MAFVHLKAATESTLYDNKGSYKNIMYRICSLARGKNQKFLGWCTSSEKYLAQTTGYSERQVQRAVAQFKKDGVFTIRTFRRGGKEFNHYKPNMELFGFAKREPNTARLVAEAIPPNMRPDVEGSITRQADGCGHDMVSKSTRQLGGVVCISSVVNRENENAKTICKEELRSAGKGLYSTMSSTTPLGEDLRGSAPEPLVEGSAPEPCMPRSSDSYDEPAPSLNPPNYSPAESSSLEVAAGAARSRGKLLAGSLQQMSVPAPPSREALESPRPSVTPTTPYQIAAELVERTKKESLDTFLRAFSLSFQLAGYLEDRKASGEKAFAFDKWEVMYTADFIEAMGRGWKYKDLEDAIHLSQTTKFRFSCCTPRRLFDLGESLMKMVYKLRREGKTLRQRLQAGYSSWYLENAVPAVMEAREESLQDESSENELSEDFQRGEDLDGDTPNLVLSMTDRIECINRECPYRFDTLAQMEHHFDACFQLAIDETVGDPQDACDERMEDAYDDFFGVIPFPINPYEEEDDEVGSLQEYSSEYAAFGIRFELWPDDKVDSSL